MKNKFSPEYIAFLNAKAVDDYRDSLLSICRYCGEKIPVRLNHTVRDQETGETFSYSPIEGLDRVCNMCLVKVRSEEIKHKWTEGVENA